METIVFTRRLDCNLRRLGSHTVQKVYWVARMCIFVVFLWPAIAFAVAGDEATHEMDHSDDVLELPEVHVHGLPLNKDQQLGPVAKSTPWPGIPSSLDGKELDDWMKARMMVSKMPK